VKLYLVSLPMHDMMGGVRHVKAFTVPELRTEWLVRAQAMHDEIMGGPGNWSMNGKPFKDQYILSEVEVESNLEYLKHLGKELFKETIKKCSESI
jgi:hypothetical protein